MRLLILASKLLLSLFLVALIAACLLTRQPAGAAVAVLLALSWASMVVAVKGGA